MCLKGIRGFEAGLWPWGVALGITKGTVLGGSKAYFDALFVNFPIEKKTALKPLRKKKPTKRLSGPSWQPKILPTNAPIQTDNFHNLLRKTGAQITRLLNLPRGLRFGLDSYPPANPTVRTILPEGESFLRQSERAQIREITRQLVDCGRLFPVFGQFEGGPKTEGQLAEFHCQY